MITTSPDESQLEMAKKLELSFDDFRELSNYCSGIGIMFLSTAFDEESLYFLMELGQKYIKIPSGEVTNLPYLRKAGAMNRKIIMSTGMMDLNEIGSAIDILTDAGTDRKNITLLHCNTQYPTPMEDVNLFAMKTIQKRYGLDVGYSDHTLGIEIPLAAVALGATVIEKHFTLDKSMKGPDQTASLNPDELAAMVKAIRNVELSIGSGIKKPSPSEKENMAIARRSIVAARNIRKGEVFTEDNLTTKRPGTGISPMMWDDVIGLPAVMDFEYDQLIEL
ncbi:MAG: N-acetylneuraminate synthase [Sulfuricurvum sp. RIFCSPLOWO2_02_43_6]|nr:MAG: N-acetylneuraminate synthase [Sulfuricurvum sp. RIFCSPLOWO2_02_43_6]